ncbi:hypothetical protein [Streptosporangium sp. NPDC051022]|uniref:hypothetical protein n=1 Tax=Streptosporangium sp. NPDC051022 TaxID=3155752 RepID=UPI003444AEBA
MLVGIVVADVSVVPPLVEQLIVRLHVGDGNSAWAPQVRQLILTISPSHSIQSKDYKQCTNYLIYDVDHIFAYENRAFTEGKAGGRTTHHRFAAEAERDTLTELAADCPNVPTPSPTDDTNR